VHSIQYLNYKKVFNQILRNERNSSRAEENDQKYQHDYTHLNFLEYPTTNYHISNAKYWVGKLELIFDTLNKGTETKVEAIANYPQPKQLKN